MGKKSSPESPRSGTDASSSRRNQNHTGRFELKAIGDEALKYDFTAARTGTHQTTITESIAHLIKSCLGGGVVTIHEAYMQCGLWTAVVLSVILGFCVSYLMYILARSAHIAYGRTHVSIMSYPDLAEATLDISHFPKLRRYSRLFRYMVDVTIMIDLFGSCCCYQVIIARAIKQIVEAVEEVQNEGNPHIRIYILGLLLPCIALCMITSLKYLAPFSLVADVFIVIVAIATVVYGVKAAERPPSEFPAYKNVAGLFEYIGVCVFSIEGIGVTLAIENNLSEPKKMPLVLLIGMTTVVCIVMTVGFFGYWGFGEKAKSPVTLNFPFTTVTTMLKVSMTFMIYVTFALNFWVPFNLAWYYIKQRHNPDRYWLTERVYRIIFVVGITIVSIVFPDVSKLMGVIGAFCLSNMGFIWPAFIELILDWAHPGLGVMKWRLIKFLIISAFGTVLMFYGTYSNVKELIKSVYYT